MDKNELRKEFKLCPRLRLQYAEAMKEVGKVYDPTIGSNGWRDYALFPKRFCKLIANIKKCNPTRRYDFCFIGALGVAKPGQEHTYSKRMWILDFIRTHFTENSYLQFTDAKTKKLHKPMGIFDHTLDREGFVPRTPTGGREKDFFDENYYSIMCQSNFCLCPAGDAYWSIRFYESLVCGCIPIVNEKRETYRTNAEAKLPYHYYLTNAKQFICRDRWVRNNLVLFKKYHTLNKSLGQISNSTRKISTRKITPSRLEEDYVS